MKLTKDHIWKVVKACEEEPGKIERITRESGFDIEFVRVVLFELLRKGIVDIDESGIWTLTSKGYDMYKNKKF